MAEAPDFLSDEDFERIKGEIPEGCPTCDGALRVVAPVPQDDGTYVGEPQACDCRSQRWMFKQYLAAGIGELYMRLDWGDYRGHPRPRDALAVWLGDWESYLRAGIGVTFSGPWGTGKTFLAMLAAKELVRRGVPVYCTTFTAMVEMFAASWRSREDQAWFERKIVGTKVLVLDDIGKEMQTSLAESTFDHVVRRRVVALRPTIITTNLGRGELDGRYGGGALSILFERSLMVDVPGGAVDFREAARERALAEIESGWRRPVR